MSIFSLEKGQNITIITKIDEKILMMSFSGFLGKFHF